MIRIIVRTDDSHMASYYGGALETTFRSFDIAAPEIEAYLAEHSGGKSKCAVQRQIIGIEVVTP